MKWREIEREKSVNFNDERLNRVVLRKDFPSTSSLTLVKAIITFHDLCVFVQNSILFYFLWLLAFSNYKN